MWLKNGRKYSMSPKVTDLLDYATSWQTWWRGLQPEWRRLADGTLSREVPDEGEEWEAIYRGGANGFFIIVLSISWWVLALDGKADEGLQDVLADTTWVLGCMLDKQAKSSGPSRGKHAQQDLEVSDIPKKK
jgi:hypothetical protein